MAIKSIECRKETADRCVSAFKPLMEIIQPGFIAGGAIRDYFAGQDIDSDIDVFFPNEDARKGANTAMRNNKAFRAAYKSEDISAYWWKGKLVQLIGKHYFENAAAAIAEFDFTVCCAGINGKDIIGHEYFLADLAGKRLAINKLPFPLSTLQRVQKYAKKGFTACSGALLEIAKAIQRIDFTNPGQNVLEFYPSGSPRFARFD